MARETTSEPSGTTRPDPGKKGVEKTSREVNQYLKKKYGNQEAIKEAYEADPKRFMGDIDSFVGERGGWQPPASLGARQGVRPPRDAIRSRLDLDYARPHLAKTARCRRPGQIDGQIDESHAAQDIHNPSFIQAARNA